MKKLFYSLLLATSLLSASACSKDASDPKCGIYNGKQLFLGPQGGCYYINSNNNKEYVPRANCNC